MLFQKQTAVSQTEQSSESASQLLPGAFPPGHGQKPERGSDLLKLL